MPTEKKAKKIDELGKTFEKSVSGVVADYRGMRTPDLTSLRVRLREAGIELKVVKNTLARRAAEGAGKGWLRGILEGPTAVAFGYKDAVTPAKVLTDYVRTTRDTLFKIKGGFLGDRLITASEVATLATLPPRDVLLSRVFGGMKSPIASLVGCLAAPLQGLVSILEQRRRQLGEVKEPQTA